MQSRTLTKNCFTTESYTPKKDENIVFISYRRTMCDKIEARECAEILEGIDGLHYWLDEKDECMQQAHAVSDDVQKSICIEQGLDASSALLGIIGPGTFNSPWIPYEIGGARGRQRFSQFFNTSMPVPHPFIAHLIHGIDKSEVPAFVALGTPLISQDEVEKWALYIADILQQKPMSVHESQNIQYQHGIQDLYEKNSQGLKPTSLY